MARTPIKSPGPKTVKEMASRAAKRSLGKRGSKK